MRIRGTDTLKVATSDQPQATIEIDLASIPEGESLQSLLRESLSLIDDTGQTSTIHVFITNSINFHEPTSSAFVMAMGGRKILAHIHDDLEALPGLRMRYSDHETPTRGRTIAHLEDGTVWLPLDSQNWYADTAEVSLDPTEIADDGERSEDDEELDDDDWLSADDDQDESKSASTHSCKQPPLRTRAARSDASVGRISRTIELLMSLPEGSVVLCGPNKKPLRKDARIATLRRRWEDA